MSHSKPPAVRPTLRLVFAGTPDFAVAPLQALIAQGYDIAAVYTQPDRPAGRGQQLQASPVKQAALAAGIPVEQPLNFKQVEDQARLASYQADVMVVVAYGLLLPQAVLDMPALGCLNIHASLLPRWRGAAPIQRAIAAGDSHSGVCIMQMEAGLDTGPVLLQHSLPISAGCTGGQLHDQLAVLGADAIVQALPALAAGQLTPTPQDASQANYAHKLSKADGQLDWTLSAQQLADQIRAFNPWPVAYCQHQGKRLRVWQATASTQVHQIQPGTVLAATDAGIEVACGEGTLHILQAQLPGKKVLTAQQLITGYDWPGITLH